MVTISGFLQRTTAEGKTFIVLELEGEIQFQKSQGSGKLYACIAKCTIPCTFDEQTARKLIGTNLPGQIFKEPCEPYIFTNPQTREEVTLNYRYSYKAPEITPPAEERSFVPSAKEVEVL